MSSVFPLGLINSAIKHILCNKYNPASISPIEIRKIYFSIPYFGQQSEKLKTELIFLISKYFKNVDFNIVLVNSFKVGSFISYKDRLPKAMCASLVYKFCCARCASEYVGSTTRTLQTRVAEHAGRSFRTVFILSVPPHSMVRTHSESCGVPVTLDDFSIIGSTSSAIDLRILESMHIF